MIRGRLRHHRGEARGGRPDEEFIEIDAAGLTAALATPRWLRDLGVTAWMLVGVALMLVGAVWLLSLTNTIVAPVITAAAVASVASPVVGWLNGRGVSRAAGAALLMLWGGALFGAVGLILAAPSPRP